MSALTFSSDQAEAFDSVAAMLVGHGIDIEGETITPISDGKSGVLAITGKAGSGKTMLLSALVKALDAAGST